MPRSYGRWVALPLLALLLVASGCGKSSKSTNPGATLDQASADDIALQTRFALDQLVTDVNSAFGAAAPASPNRVRPLRAQWDTTTTVGGLTIAVSANFFDAQDRLLAAYGPEAVKLIWTSTVTGTIQTVRDTALVGHHAVLQFTGIQPADTAVTLDGSAVDTLLNVFRSYDGTRTRFFYWRSSLAGAAIVWGKTREYPWSGTVTYVVAADRLRSNSLTDVEAHLSATVVVTFNGTSQPDVVINGTWHYRWNMLTGDMVRV